MSKGFGVDTYGIPFYGPEQVLNSTISPSVNPFTATQSDYGEIVLSWTAPLNTPWKFMQLVRSTYGYPATAKDGVLLQQFTTGTMQKTYDDAGLTPGVIYYYTMFVTLEAPTWSNAVTYSTNQQVLFSGQYWTSLQNSNTNHTPAVGSAFWASTAYVPTWLPAGYAGTLALANDGYGVLLYNRAPQPYKITSSDIYPNTIPDNQSLQNYFNVMGFALDQMKNFYDSLLQVNNPDTVSATSLDILGQQLGINTNYMTTPQQRRQRIKTATVNYQMKGEPQSVHNLIAQLTGWDSTVTDSSNLLTSGDQAAALHPLYDQWNTNTTYFPNQIIQFNGYNYKNILQSVGTAQAPTGSNTSNTWWQVQLQVLDNTISFNPATNKYYTWGNTDGSSSFNGVLTGLPHPTNTAINNWNAFAITTPAATPDIVVGSVASLFTPNYSSGTNYKINANVLFTDGYYYTALKANGPATTVVTPGTNSAVWKAFYYTTSDFPNVFKDGAPIAVLPFWNATTQYTIGQRVQYNGITYQAGLNNINSAPTGFYYSNPNWIFVEPNQKAIINSLYTGAINSSAVSLQLFAKPLFYDVNGTVIKNYSANYNSNITSQGTWARFITDYTELNGTSEPTVISVPTSSNQWTSSAGLWKTSFGMASVNQAAAGTTTYVTALLPAGFAGNKRYGVTFASDFVDTAHKTHGIVFSFTNSSNFWYATRTSLWQVSAGVETLRASWTRLNTGDRMIIDVSTAITVYKYARDGKGTLTQIGTFASGPAAGQTGLIQKYSASGAL